MLRNNLRNNVFFSKTSDIKSYIIDDSSATLLLVLKDSAIVFHFTEGIEDAKLFSRLKSFTSATNSNNVNELVNKEKREIKLNRSSDDTLFGVLDKFSQVSRFYYDTASMYF